MRIRGCAGAVEHVEQGRCRDRRSAGAAGSEEGREEEEEDCLLSLSMGLSENLKAVRFL